MRIEVKTDKYEISEGGVILYVNEEDLREALSSKMNKIKSWFRK